MAHNDIDLDTKLQSNLHVACKLESDWWKIKSRCKWLKDVDRNTSFFHKQVEARKNFNSVLEIQSQGILISNFEDIKTEATQHFSELFKAHPIVEDSDLLNLVPNAINNTDNEALTQNLVGGNKAVHRWYGG